MKRSRSHVLESLLSTAFARIAIALSALMFIGQLAALGPAAAATPSELRVSPPAVSLGTVGTYSVLGGTGVVSTGGTALGGDLGLSPSGSITGFGPGTVAGVIHDKDAAAAQAQTDRRAAYNDARGRTGATPFSGDQIGKTYVPGLYSTAAVFLNTGVMTLDAGGVSSAVFIFQVDAAFSPAARTRVVLAGGAKAANVFWQVNGAVSIEEGSSYPGIFLVNGALTLGNGANLDGRALANGTVTLSDTTINEPQTTPPDVTAPVVTIDGGSSRTTNDATPTISGMTDEPVGRTVTVTVEGQILAATVTAGGAWTVTAALLADGAHTVVARATDLAGNTGSATQTLTTNATGPVVTIDGGSSRTTNDATPMISGTTSEPAGRTITVVVGGQTLVATVTAGGAWQVTSAALADGAYTVVAQATDLAGNTANDTQSLTIDATAPLVAIDGGSSRTTNDATPTISGTTSEPVGSIVTVSVEGQSLTATVTSAGFWQVTSAALTDGVHSVLARVSDEAGNPASASQSLTVASDPPPGTMPFVTIDGGSSRTTSDATPTISGTTSEPVGSFVTVRVDGRRLEAVITAGMVWSLTVAKLRNGAYVVGASVLGRDGVTYSASQSLTVRAAAGPVLRADAAIKLPGGRLVGVGVYGGAVRQQVGTQFRGRSAPASFVVRLQNRGGVADRINVRGTSRATSFKVVYRVAGKDVSRAVKSGKYRTARLAPRQFVQLTVTITRTRSARPGDRAVFRILAGSAQAAGTKASSRDTVRAAVRIAKARRG